MTMVFHILFGLPGQGCGKFFVLLIKICPSQNKQRDIRIGSGQRKEKMASRSWYKINYCTRLKQEN